MAVKFQNDNKINPNHKGIKVIDTSLALYPTTSEAARPNLMKIHFNFHLSDHKRREAAKPVISSTGIFVAIANNILYGSKVLIFFNAKNH